MKTRTKIIATGIFMLIACFGFLSAHMSVAGNQDPVSPDNKICYTVQINNINNFTGFGHRYVIMVTDGRGRLVAPVQSFRPGVWYYNFFEAGPVRGTRIARMAEQPSSHGSSPIPPCIRTGNFLINTCYLFVVTPKPDAQPEGKPKE